MSTKLFISLLVITASLCFGMEEGKKKIAFLWITLCASKEVLTKEDVRNACQNNPYVANYSGTEDSNGPLKLCLDALERGSSFADACKNGEFISIKKLRSFICCYEIVTYLNDDFYGKDKKEALLRKQKELQQLVKIYDITHHNRRFIKNQLSMQDLVKEAFKGFTENECLKDYDFHIDSLGIRLFLKELDSEFKYMNRCSTTAIRDMHASYDIYRYLGDSEYNQEDKLDALEKQLVLEKELERRSTLIYQISSWITPKTVVLTGVSLFALLFIQRYFSSR